MEEINTHADVLEEDVERLQHQRDQLAEALRGCLDELEAWRESFPSFADNEDVDAKARAALKAMEDE